MISSKTLYSKYFAEYKLDANTLQKLQNTLLEILVDVKKVCDKHNIDYMLSGGTLLGAIRHNGFIPWDDDIDIMMCRTEYERFVPLFRNTFSDKYMLVEPLETEYYVSKAPKIFLKNSEYIEIANAGIPEYGMVFLDLFIIENMAPVGIQRQIVSKIYDFAYKASSLCVDYKFPSPIIENKAETNYEIRKYYSFRKRFGWLFTLFGGMTFYLRIIEKIARKYNHTGWLGVPSAISYNREIFEESVFLEVCEHEFCGYNMKIPKHYDLYLQNLYGDYMKIPPVEKREMHVAYRIHL